MKKDLSMVALVFFITRCFFNLYTYDNLYSFLLTSFIIFIALIFLKKWKKNIFKIKLVKWFYILCIFLIFIFITINAINFININYFRYSNYFTTSISLLVISYIIGKDKIKTIASISEVFLFIFLIFSILISIGLISLIKIKNYSYFIKINDFSISIFPFLIIFVLFYIKNNNMITGYIIGSFSAFFDLILLIGSLGSKLPKTYTYPGISILKTITFFKFINHLDKLFSFIYLFEYTVTLAFLFNIIINLTKKESI